MLILVSTFQRMDDALFCATAVGVKLKQKAKEQHINA